ncbi:MAG TPA: lanthionine synthetase LanC family protein [Thermoanaerobaculia bacterium]|nr:lanthionine synthetase LanC family protein [Thermoanaerobaculia bacterium]
MDEAANRGADLTSPLDVACSLGDEIWRRRVVARGGALTWYRPRSDSNKETGEQFRLDPFLYDGISGVALFYAALEAVRGDGENRERCLGALQGLRRLLAALVADPERSRNPAIGLGGALGLGSLLYVLSQVARLLGDEELLDEARALLPLFTAERIDRDAQFDLLYGSAGAILALLAFERVDGSDLPLELARKCAEHLLRNQGSDDQDGPRAWSTLRGVARLGNLNHGASGICHALLQLYRRTGDPGLLAAAEEGFAYESRLFDPGRGGWRDLRFPDRDRFERSWCSGSPGMAVVRLAAHDLVAGSRLQEEATVAIGALLQSPLSGTDHICCGNCGVVEAVLSAAILRKDAALRDAAGERLSLVIRRTEPPYQFIFRHSQDPADFDPSFFTGAAGVGYTCLRLIKPEMLPSVALLQPVGEGSPH